MQNSFHDWGMTGTFHLLPIHWPPKRLGSKCERNRECETENANTREMKYGLPHGGYTFAIQVSKMKTFGYEQATQLSITMVKASSSLQIPTQRADMYDINPSSR